MKKHSFPNYKKALSVVLSLSYVLQLLSLGISHYFLKPSADGEWAFLIGFWGINILLIFLVNFFHTGVPKSLRNCSSILISLMMSGCYFYALCYRIYWLAIVLFISITVITFLLRYIGMLKFSCCENEKYSNEESIIRISIYILPTIFLSVVCRHVENVLPHSFFSMFVRFVYFVVAFFLIAFTYLLWYKNMEKTIPNNQLIAEIIWLMICFSAFVIGMEYFKDFVFIIVLPMLGIVPILIRHKKTKFEK